MIQIPPTSIPATAVPHGDPAQPPAPTAPQATTATAVTEGGSSDVRAKFDALFGTPQVQSFYADANGAGGGRSGATRKADPLVGAEIPGQKGVVVQRSLGDPRGYETKFHAAAWARAVGSERAMIVFGKDKRWHAVETNVVAKDAAGGSGAIKDAFQIGKLDPAKFDALKAEAMKDNDRAKWRTFAAYATGLPESDIAVIFKGEPASATQVNINLSPDFKVEGRVPNFDPKRPATVELGRAAFDRPANVPATLAHEEVHASHRRLTNDLYAKYEAAPHGKQSFREWVARSTKDVRLADIVAGYQDGTTAPTELEAHTEAARVSFASGDLTQAKTDLQKVSTLANLPTLQTQRLSVAVLKELRDGLGADARKAWDEVAAKAGPGSVVRDVAKFK